jgi:hypothetical protein
VSKRSATQAEPVPSHLAQWLRPSAALSFGRELQATSESPTVGRSGSEGRLTDGFLAQRMLIAAETVW